MPFRKSPLKREAGADYPIEFIIYLESKMLPKGTAGGAWDEQV